MTHSVELARSNLHITSHDARPGSPTPTPPDPQLLDAFGIKKTAHAVMRFFSAHEHRILKQALVLLAALATGLSVGGPVGAAIILMVWTPTLAAMLSDCGIIDQRDQHYAKHLVSEFFHRFSMCTHQVENKLDNI